MQTHWKRIASLKQLRTLHTHLLKKRVIEQRGIDLNKPENEEMFHLREALKPFPDLLTRRRKLLTRGRTHGTADSAMRARFEAARYTTQHPAMANELSGPPRYACENIGDVTSWPKTDESWKKILLILLKASTDPHACGDNSNDTKDDGWPSWGWPAPRLDAARGLPISALTASNWRRR